MHHLARERIGMASERMKTRYDARATGHDFYEGNKVWLWNTKRRKGLSPKLQANLEVRSNSRDGQLAIPNDARYAQMETNMGIGRPRKGSNSEETVL
ncbi:kinectin [Trichonephila clavipes]|nr:kinectin [Trichonephila clavipes]